MTSSMYVYLYFIIIIYICDVFVIFSMYSYDVGETCYLSYGMFWSRRSRAYKMAPER